MTGGAVLLAAGYARRFGSDKRRHVLPDGTPLLIASLRLYRRAFDDVVVVLRPEDRDLAEAVLEEADTAATPTGAGTRGPAGVGPGVRIVFCPDARLGMGHSLAAGTAAAGDWRYLFVALADMAWVRPETLGRLIAAMEAADERHVVQPVYRGTPGHPVGFGAGSFARLTRLTGDEGARSVVRAAEGRLIRVDLDDPGVLRDLDELPPGASDRSGLAAR